MVLSIHDQLLMLGVSFATAEFYFKHARADDLQKYSLVTNQPIPATYTA